MSDGILDTRIQLDLVFEILHHFPNIRRGYALGIKNARLLLYDISDRSGE